MIGFFRSDLPVARDATAHFLPWLVAVMVFLAALALTGVMGLDGLLDRWSRDASGTLTIQVPAATGANAETETEARLERAVRLLESDPQVAKATAVSRERLAEMLEPWLGSAELMEALPVPRLIDVTVSSGMSPDLDALTGRLRAVAPGAAIDDHRVWLARLIRLAEGLRMLAWAVIGLVAVATAAMVIHATSTTLAVHRPHIEVLHLIGATDSYIARQFARRAFALAVLGGIGGLAMAAPVLWVIGGLVQRLEGGLIPEITIGVGQWLVLLLLPPVAGVLSNVTARRTVRRTLTRLL
ncbi:MAG: FtsX-like permease family protein [Rhodospirillaceae bacterium]